MLKVVHIREGVKGSPPMNVNVEGPWGWARDRRGKERNGVKVVGGSSQASALHRSALWQKQEVASNLSLPSRELALPEAGPGCHTGQRQGVRAFFWSSNNIRTKAML